MFLPTPAPFILFYFIFGYIWGITQNWVMTTRMPTLTRLDAVREGCVLGKQTREKFDKERS